MAIKNSPIRNFTPNLSQMSLKLHLKVKLSTHYSDVIMGTIASQITSLTIVHSTVYLDSDQRKHQSSASLAFVRWIHRWPVNSPHKWPVTQKCFHLMTSSWFVNFQCVFTVPKTTCQLKRIFRGCHHVHPLWCAIWWWPDSSQWPPSHYNDVIMSTMASQITSLAIFFTQPFIQVQIKENIKAPRHCLCAGNSPVTGEFPAQMASNAESFSIWWRHHEDDCTCWLNYTTDHKISISGAFW